MPKAKPIKLIVRYDNRKMWCAVERKYYNLEDIIDLVRNAENFMVKQHTDGANITLEVLRRAVGKTLPTDMGALQKMIRSQDSSQPSPKKTRGDCEESKS